MKCEFESKTQKNVCSKANCGCPKNKMYCILKAPIRED
jgi:hypothetical protein